MDNKEVHYVAYDPEEMWNMAMQAYIENGGDVLYPGDEKEILLRAVQSVLIQNLAVIDTGLRMATRRYAEGEYLDLYGDKRRCPRIAAQKAKAKARILFAASGRGRTIAKGSAMTADGEILYLTTEDIIQTGYAQEVIAEIECGQDGSVGNGLQEGTQMQMLVPNGDIISIFVTEAASGGQDAELDKEYRERIGEHGLSSTTTGPSSQYKAVSMAVSSEIIDVNPVNLGAGRVGIYVLTKATDRQEAILNDVAAALSPNDIRPLNDEVVVSAAVAVPYTLYVQYSFDSNTGVGANIENAVEEYKAWQEQTIKRAFNPDKLKAMIYQAGATRVIWGEGSNFNGGEVEYTEIAENEYCSGNISLAVMGNA